MRAHRRDDARARVPAERVDASEAEKEPAEPATKVAKQGNGTTMDVDGTMVDQLLQACGSLDEKDERNKRVTELVADLAQRRQRGGG